MKQFVLIIVLLFASCIGKGQTYSFNNSTTASVSSTTVTVRNVTVTGVPTSGMVLRQVNVYFGNGTSLYSGDMSGFTLTLTDPSGNVINLITPGGSFTTSGNSNSSNKIFNIKFRDHAALKTPKAQMTATSSTLSKGYPFNQGYYKPEGSFSSFNTTTNVNGTWGFRMSGYSTSYARTFNSVELIFGPAFVVTDIRATNPNQSCGTRQCFQTGELFWARNVGYPTNQASAPPNTVGGCGWNGQKDNMAWFYFKASSTTATISASGFSTVQESSVFKTTDCSSYSAVTGGCGPSDLFAGSPHIIKYFNGSYAGGYAWNQGYSLSGLTIGDEYIFVLDGQSGTQSEFYIEMLAGGDGGCSTLPVKLANYEINCKKGKSELSWTTTTEINNDYFAIEKAVQNTVKEELSFMEIGRVIGSGNSNIEQNYTFTDLSSNQTIAKGKAYYRLKQVDYNGAVEYFYPKIVDCIDDENSLELYPNPNNGKFMLKGLKEGDVVSIANNFGIDIYKQVVSESKVEINISNEQKGAYVLTVFGESQVHKFKMLLN